MKIEIDEKIKYKLSVWLVLFVILTIANIYFWWVISWLVSIIYIIILCGIIYWIYVAFKKFRKKEYIDFYNFSIVLVYRLMIFVYVVFIVFWLFAYYHNNTNPFQTPLITLEWNWKTIKFQTMSHIWTQDYYDQVEKNLRQAKEDWYKLYFEWVILDDEEKLDKFNSLMWFEFTDDFYENFSKLYGLVDQDNEYLISIFSWNSVNADAKLSEIIDIYEKNFWEILTGDNQEIIDMNQVILDRLAELNDRQLMLLRYFNKSLINAITKNKYIWDSITELMWKERLMDVILNERNKVLADYIINSDDMKIFILYWKLHFEWTLELLRQNWDWEIINEEPLYPTVWTVEIDDK